MKLSLVTETYPPEINGVSMTLGRLTSSLAHNEWEIHLVAPKQNSRKDYCQNNKIHFLEMPGLPIPRYPDLNFGLPSLLRLKKYWENTKPDLVHIATEGPLGLSAIYTARKLNIPTITSFHTNFHHYSRYYGCKWMQKPVLNYLKFFHNRGKLTLAPCQEMKDHLIEEGFNSVDIFSRGIDRILFNPNKYSAALRKQWTASDNTRIFLYVGRISSEKNIPLAIKAFRKIEEKYPDSIMVLVGDGPIRKKLEKENPDLIFAGAKYDQELAQYYASANMFLFPSTTETFGNVIPEALSSGLPCTTFNYAAGALFIKSPVMGLLPEYGSNESFIRCALEMASQYDICNRQKIHDMLETQPWTNVFNSYKQISSTYTN
jgi:glycosyltransferase involved in cell wall biosynthesis